MTATRNPIEKPKTPGREFLVFTQGLRTINIPLLPGEPTEPEEYTERQKEITVINKLFLEKKAIQIREWLKSHPQEHATIPIYRNNKGEYFWATRQMRRQALMKVKK